MSGSRGLVLSLARLGHHLSLYFASGSTNACLVSLSLPRAADTRCADGRGSDTHADLSESLAFVYDDGDESGHDSLSVE